LEKRKAKIVLEREEESQGEKKGGNRRMHARIPLLEDLGKAGEIVQGKTLVHGTHFRTGEPDLSKKGSQAAEANVPEVFGSAPFTHKTARRREARRSFRREMRSERV
jgi:hypothetical protein